MDIAQRTRVRFDILESGNWLYVQAFHYAMKYFASWSPATLGSESIEEVAKATVIPADRHLEQSATAGPLLLKAFYRGPGSSSDSVIMEVIS